MTSTNKSNDRPNLGHLATLAVVLTFIAPLAAYGQTVVSLTFDDETEDQFQALDILTAHGMHATFLINSGRIGLSGYFTLAQVQQVAQAGNEIAGHTVSHPDLPTLVDDEQKRQICNDRVALSNLGFSVRNFAYPFGDTDPVTEQIVAQCGYNSARGIGDILSPGSCSGCPLAETIPPGDLYHTKTPDSVKNWMTLNDLETYVTQAEQNGGGWVQIVFHHVCDSCGTDYSVSAATLTSFLDWLQPRSASGTVVKTIGDVIGGPVQPLVNGPPPPPPLAGGNLLTNPSMELDVNPADGIPDCWQLSSFGTNTGSFARTNDAEDGAWAEQMQITSFTSGGRRILSTQDLGACAPTAYPGHSYQATGWYKATGTQQRFVAFYRNAAGGWVWWAQSPLLPTSATYTQGTWTVPALPTGATAISISLSLYGVGSVTADNFSLTDTDTTPPTVTITSPLNGAIVTGTVTLSASASDAGGIADVDFLINGTAVGSISQPPYTMPWDTTTVTNPNTAITASAIDLAGNEAQSSIMVTVGNPPPPDTTPPVTTIACNGTTCGSGWYNKPVTVTLSAIDLQSGVAATRYTLDGSAPTANSLLYASPFSLSQTATLGFASWDVAGNAETPHFQTIQIDTVSPTNVTVVAPANGAQVTGTTTIIGSATDNVGVYRMRFFLDGKQLGTRTTTPLQWHWDTTTTTKGSHTIYVEADDAAGNSAVSPSISVVVY